MKTIVCYIDMLCRCGAQRVMSNLITYFYKKEYNVILINDFKRDDSLPHYDVPDGVERLYLREGISGNLILKNIQRVLALRKIIKKKKPDIVLSFLGRPNLRMLIATIGLKCRKVASVRNDPNREYGTSHIKKWLVNRLFEQADGIVFQTGDAAQYFTEKIQNKSRIIFNPVNDDMYADGITTDRKNVITLGRLEPQKNHVMLIDAFKKIADKYPQENMYIYGEGPLRSKLEEYIEKQGLKDRVFLPGNIADVKSALLGAKVFALSSDYEGLPNALMEAMATGTPSVSTNCPCGGPKTLFENDSQGLLTEVGDVDGFADALDRLLGNENLRDSIGKSARERAEAFRDARIFNQWEEYFKSIVKNTR